MTDHGSPAADQDRPIDVRQAEAVDAADRPEVTERSEARELREPSAGAARLIGMTPKQSAFLAHVGNLYAAIVGDPHANSRTIREADAALQHVVRDAGLAPRDIAAALKLPLAAVLA